MEDDGSVYTEENDIKVNIRPGELVRACGVMETFVAKSSKYREFNIVLPVWLEAQKELKIKDVLDALWIVSRQIPHLQFCHSKQNGKIWFKRMTKLSIDFSTSIKSELEEIHAMLDTEFNVWNGPLWKVKLIVPSSKNSNNKFSYVVMITLLHSISDGITNTNIIRDFVVTLNLITAGKSVKPKFSPVIAPIDIMASSCSSFPFLVKYLIKRTLSIILNSPRIEFHSLVSNSSTSRAKTKVLFDSFTENETNIIAKFCKENKITINTFICTAVNIALTAPIKLHSQISNKPQKIVMAHAVNLRRHFNAKYTNASGYHAAGFEVIVKASVSDADNFVSTALKNQSSFKTSLEVRKRHLKILPIFKFSHLMLSLNSFLVNNGLKCRSVLHYTSSNMGNLKNFFPDTKDDDNVEITFFTTSVSNQLSGLLFHLFFQTFKERLILTMNYYTCHMTEKEGKALFNSFYTYIRYIIRNYDPQGM